MSNLAQELLEDAAAGVKNKPWIEKLSPDHRKAVEAAKSSWQELPRGSVSATRLADSIVRKMQSLGYDMPSIKQVQRWLTNNPN